MANAKYGISMARRLGARVYALPEDIVEVTDYYIHDLIESGIDLQGETKDGYDSVRGVDVQRHCARG